MGEITSAFSAAYSDGPVSSPNQPDKEVLRNLGLIIEQNVEAAALGMKSAKTWAELSAVSGSIQLQKGEVTNDSGNHTDPVVGGTVPNKGSYSWNTSPAGWKRTGDLIDPDAIAASQEQMQEQIDAIDRRTANGLVDLNRAINDQWRSIHVVAVGDSITWGVGASDASTDTGGGGTLADPRDGIDSQSWANKFRKHLGQMVCDRKNRELLSPGCARYSADVYLDIAGDPSVRVVETATGLPATKSVTAVPGSKLGRVVDVYPGYELQFEYVGDQFYVVHALLTNVAGSSFQLYIDGVLFSNVNTYGGPSFSHEHGEGPSFGRHAIRLVPLLSATRFEAIHLIRRARFDNQGLSGTYTGQWLPSGANLPAAVPANATHAIIMLGTNDRIRGRPDPQSSARIYDNLNTILNWFDASRPTVEIILMAANKALGNKEAIDNPTDYAFTMAEVAQAIKRVAQERELAFIDHYTLTVMMDDKGQNFTTDNLHPNDAGYEAMFENIVSKLG